MTDKAYAVPLHELLASVPREARLVIDDDDGMGTRFIPVGRYCNEAAEALRARLAQPDLITHADVEQLARIEKLVEDVDPYTAPPQREWQGLTDKEIDDMMPYVHNEFDILENRDFAHAIEAKLKEKNT